MTTATQRNESRSSTGTPSAWNRSAATAFVSDVRMRGTAFVARRDDDGRAMLAPGIDVGNTTNGLGRRRGLTVHFCRAASAGTASGTLATPGCRASSTRPDSR